MVITFSIDYTQSPVVFNRISKKKIHITLNPSLYGNTTTLAKATFSTPLRGGKKNNSFLHTHS